VLLARLLDDELDVARSRLGDRVTGIDAEPFGLTVTELDGRDGLDV
jgi:hypothetical protein